MTRKTRARRGAREIIYALIASTAMLCTLPPHGWAMLAPVQGAVAATEGQPYNRASDMKTVQTALESKIVRGRLNALGLSEKEIESRLSRLSDSQVHQLAKDINTLSPGGDVSVDVVPVENVS